MCIRDRTTLGERCEEISVKVDAVKHQVTSNRDQLTERQEREFNDIRDEMNRLRTFPSVLSGLTHLDGREQIDFRAYIKNPLEFLERVEEIISRNRENRWSVIKGMLDESFRNTFDNWWTATRHEVENYAAVSYTHLDVYKRQHTHTVYHFYF